jgi:hypothetical protein
VPEPRRSSAACTASSAALALTCAALSCAALSCAALFASAATACNGDPVEVSVADDPSNQVNMTTGLVPDEAPPVVNAACVTQTSAAEPRQVALYMMLDSSGSMLDSTGGLRNKWDSVVRAVRGFSSETLDSDLQVGLQFFPLAKPGSRFNCSVESDCGPDSDGDGISDGGPCFLKTCRSSGELCATGSDCAGGAQANPCLPFGVCSGSDPDALSFCELLPGAPVACSGNLGVCVDFDRPCTNATTCESAAYAKPAVEIGLVSQNLAFIDQALRVQAPQGQTPTVPALTGAIDHARDWGAAHPDQTVVVLLATDGSPTHCAPAATRSGLSALEPIDDVLEVASSGSSGAIPVRTFVVGVFEPGNTGAIANVNQIARAGGTEQAFFIDSSGEVDQQFLDALRAIRSGQLGCEFQLPESRAQLDYFEVNLQLRAGASSQQLPFVRDRAGCDANPSGWHYDSDPNQSRPTSIQVCPGVCSQIKAAASASLQLQLGCATIIR